MTSISATTNAALLILQQVRAPASQENGNESSATDEITAIVNKVSTRDSPVKMQAASQINSGLLDVKQTNGEIVSGALQFLESEDFKSSDPSVKDTLKKLISEDGDRFAALVKAEKANHAGITDDNAIANAIYGLIKGNRDRFTDNEFVIGFRFSNGGSNMLNIEDINGNSTSGALSARHSANMAEWAAAVDGFLEAGNDTTKLTNSEGGKLKSVITSVFAGLAEQAAWNNKWREAFGF
ncbi:MULTISPECIES: hypothetical protein [unclassified Sinorhizobium]|uniref:hypothetical protein n=1 Tax=unclassified Sinorhizobium TaxID=2613772 RepID=UPI0024C31A92|nr:MULTISPECIES: hypothetical protein [unclassified Sinorhizobium]MDK1376719.1 hypothetical protein [Sinorhizobium sp. 6-70]MDK1482769.1 hypothetical protein [Sinorhizobium sp. 6-117]